MVVFNNTSVIDFSWSLIRRYQTAPHSVWTSSASWKYAHNNVFNHTHRIRHPFRQRWTWSQPWFPQTRRAWQAHLGAPGARRSGSRGRSGLASCSRGTAATHIHDTHRQGGAKRGRANPVQSITQHTNDHANAPERPGRQSSQTGRRWRSSGWPWPWSWCRCRGAPAWAPYWVTDCCAPRSSRDPRKREHPVRGLSRWDSDLRYADPWSSLRSKAGKALDIS